MLESLFLVGVGIVIGWNVLPQPAWAKNLYDRVIGWFKGPGV